MPHRPGLARAQLRMGLPSHRPAQMLPAPRLDSSISVESALHRRRSIRTFDQQSLTLAEIGQLLWAAQGVTDEEGRRTTPSAGAICALECFAVTPTALLHYAPTAHQLVEQFAGDHRGALAAAAFSQSAVAEAGVVIVLACDHGRIAEKYGEDRAPRYAFLEAGHAAQNVLLQAVALGLGAVPVGAFDDADVSRVLRLDAGAAPLYLIAAGRPAR